MKALTKGKQFRIEAFAGWTACLAALALCPGCIVLYLPANHYATDSRKNMGRDATSYVFPGQTTREQVVVKFGEPDSQYLDDVQMIYQWTKVKGYVFFVCVLGKFGGADRYIKRYQLVITFDKDGLVANREIRELVERAPDQFEQRVQSNSDPKSNPK